MPRLADADLQRLQQQLSEREATLRAEVADMREEEEERPGAFAFNQNEDQGEIGEERIRNAVRYAEKERDIGELRDIEDARERMADGSYGACEECGRDIPVQRLLAQPSARRCVTCQEKFERKYPAAPRISAGL